MNPVPQPPGTLARTRGALRSPDFRRLFAIRLISQCADGFFQATLVASVVFSVENQDTVFGFFKATLIVALPFTVLGPFVGVFIDRWSRRRIMTLAPLVKAALAALVLVSPERYAVPFYAGALLVLSVNRFFLSTAQAVVPRLVPTEDLLMANSLATVGGTVALLVGVFTGGKLVDAAGSELPAIVAAALAWLGVSAIAARIGSDLAPLVLPESAELLRHQVRRVAVEFTDGAGRLIRTPRAIGPIVSITVDQIGQGVILTLALVVLRESLGQGVGSFSNMIGAGGVGVLLGIVTVGRLEERFPKERIVAGAFVIGGLALLGAGVYLRGWSILLTGLVVGMTFAWKKIPVDTMVQESLPDGYRGRVFAVYDVFYNSARVLAAAISLVLFPALGTSWSVAMVGLVFLAWAPVLPRWIGGTPEIRLRFRADDRAQERPIAVAWGGVEEPVELIRRWTEDRAGTPQACMRLALRDGSVLDVSRAEAAGTWRIDRERD